MSFFLIGQILTKYGKQSQINLSWKLLIVLHASLHHGLKFEVVPVCVHGDCHLFHDAVIISRAYVLYLSIQLSHIDFSFQIKQELETRSFVCICGMKASVELCVVISAVFIRHDLFI